MVAVVLMGAGASRSCEDNVVREDRARGTIINEYPPLGNGPCGLFARLELHKKLPKRLPNGLKRLFRENFEAGMAEYYKRYEGDTMAFHRAMTGYLASFKPIAGCDYIKLVESIPSEKVIYATLNYDLLLELSACSVGLLINYENLLDGEGVRVIKPHGSSNFWPNVAMMNIKGLVMKDNFVDVESPVTPMSFDKTLHLCETSCFAPAIAMYAEGKNVRVSPNYVKSHQQRWVQAVMNAEKIFITGVNIHSSDTHIWDALANCAGDVFYFGYNQSDEDGFKSWKDSVIKENIEYINGDFKRAVDIITADLK